MHPLPLYFALASLCTLVVLVRLLRSGAAPGTLLLAFCLLRPAMKLALEPLRAEPALPWLMIGIPATTLAAATAVSVSLFFRRHRLASATLLPLAILTLTASVVRAEEPPWAESLQRYAQNPLRNRRLLRRLERQGRGDHPPVVLLALADARLRSGSFAAAERLFARVTAAGPGEPLSTWALLGHAWASLLAGDAPRPIGAERSAVAAVVSGLVDAAEHRGGDAGRSFARVVDDPRTPPTLRAAARLVAAYARYWGREDDAGTIAAFDAAVAAADASLVDDARYGAARARLRAGDVGGALPRLHDLATWHVNGRPAPAPPALVALDRGAVLRAGFERYRRAGIRTPEQQLHLMLDGDGATLARAALRELGEAAPEPYVARPAHIVPAATPARAAAPAVRAPARSSPSLDVVSAWLRRALLGAALLTAILLVHTLWWDRRIPPGGRHGSD